MTNKKRIAFSKSEDWIALIVILVLVAGLLPIFLPYTGRARPHARRISCSSNLKQIGLALKQYAMDYNDYFPSEENTAGFEQLRTLDYLTDYGIYRCPQTMTARCSSGPINSTNCDYTYINGSQEGDPSDIPLSFDRPSEDIDHVNVLYLDGHVKIYRLKLKSNKDIIIFLQSMHSYPPKIYKRLLKKARDIDASTP